MRIRSVQTLLTLAFTIVSVGCGGSGPAAQVVTSVPVASTGLARTAATSKSGDSFIEINDPKGVRGTRAWSLDSRGDVIGSYDDANKVRHGFIWHDGRFTTVDNPHQGHGEPGPLGPQGTTLYDINASGDITGRYINSKHEARSFVFHHGTFALLDDPAAGRGRGKGTQADGINDEGDVVGDFIDQNFNVRGFVLHASTFTTINAPHAEHGKYVGTHAFGINDAGVIVLHTQPLNQIFKSYLLRDGRFTRVNDPHGSLGTILSGINPAGVIVGAWLDGNNVSHGMILCDGRFTTHDDPEAGRASGQGTGLTRINSRGDIAGWYTDSENHDHGFLLRPAQVCTQ